MKVGVSSKESLSFLSPSGNGLKSAGKGRLRIEHKKVKFDYKGSDSQKQLFRPPLTLISSRSGR